MKLFQLNAKAQIFSNEPKNIYILNNFPIENDDIPYR